MFSYKYLREKSFELAVLLRELGLYEPDRASQAQGKHPAHPWLGRAPLE